MGEHQQALFSAIKLACSYKGSKLCMCSESLAILKTHCLEPESGCFQKCAQAIAWPNGICNGKCACCGFRTKTAGMSLGATQLSAARDTLDALIFAIMCSENFYYCRIFRDPPQTHNLRYSSFCMRKDMKEGPRITICSLAPCPLQLQWFRVIVLGGDDMIGKAQLLYSENVAGRWENLYSSVS